MKKFLSVLLAALMVISLAACSSSSNSGDDSSNTNEEETPTTITITALNAAKEEIELEVPFDPQRVVTLDMACLDIIDNLGLGDRVVGSSNVSLDYLMAYSDVANLGTIKEADMEAIMQCEPDIIFIGGRLSSSYDALSEIAPVVFLATDTDLGLVESTKKIASTVASIFGLEDETDAKINAYQDRIAALAEFAAGKTAVVGMATSGSFNVLGNDGRCSLIGNEIGFENVGLVADKSDSSTATHGNEVSFEMIVDVNPDYIFVMDRDAAIGTNGAQLAQEIMENELIMKTDAYQNGHIVYLEHPGIWYTAEGGITSLGIMLEDLESALLSE